MFYFDALSHAIVRQRVLCVGDLMLDEFVYGEVARISPEAPAPVIAVQRSETNIGGAGNVARNIAALGARCIFAGLVGEDEAGAKLKADLAREKLIDIVLLSDYAKGVLTARVIRNIIDAAKKLGKRVIVDPKSANFAIYRGAALLTPNRKEFAEATRSRADY